MEPRQPNIEAAIQAKFLSLQVSTFSPPPPPPPQTDLTPPPWVHMGSTSHTLVVDQQGVVDTNTLARHFIDTREKRLLDLGKVAWHPHCVLDSKRISLPGAPLDLYTPTWAYFPTHMGIFSTHMGIILFLFWGNETHMGIKIAIIFHMGIIIN